MIYGTRTFLWKTVGSVRDGGGEHEVRPEQERTLAESARDAARHGGQACHGRQAVPAAGRHPVCRRRP